MAMIKGQIAENPDAYVDALTGWQRGFVETLRAAIHAGGEFSETIKWTNLLFVSNGPCMVVRAEEHRVIIAFFRGKRLVHLDPRIKPSGKFELANIVFTRDPEIAPAVFSEWAAAAASLNAEHGDPTRKHR
jgi:hypothetical protein